MRVGERVRVLEIGAEAYERQINDLVEEDEDTTAYVARLEEEYDKTMRPESGAELIEELADQGVIGAVAPRHFSFAGNQPDDEAVGARIRAEVAETAREHPIYR